MRWYLLLAGIGLAVGITVLIYRRGRRRPQTVEEKAAAARSAMRAIRRDSPRPGRYVVGRARGVPDRHSGAIAENAVYGDAAQFGSGGGGGAAD
ncbi:hypothetical protein JMF97_09265 [Micromonospora fiedleri]|uniref:Uncharacterized protein n=1 Tax=Micromonospora fiedleri TaxID=1157498 RepID=A0ABS1UJ39_9ACTN|nr:MULTISPECIES: hypothetical protein [Micromonospora]MBL6276347.1 hypothetical protein [Micromonospora fiedleri]WSK40480.1 hypothetical protein OG712_18255 [Micromonospora maris]